MLQLERKQALTIFVTKLLALNFIFIIHHASVMLKLARKLAGKILVFIHVFAQNCPLTP